MSEHKTWNVNIIFRMWMCFLFFTAAGVSTVYGSEGIVIMRMFFPEDQRTRDRDNEAAYENTISIDIGKYLTPYYRVFMDTTLSRNRDTGITRSDAEKALSNYPANFILYGSITNESNFLQGRFELYDKRNNRVEYFYASDRIDEYDRLIQTISNNILSWFQVKTDKVDELLDAVTELQQQFTQIQTEQESIESQSQEEVVVEKKEIVREPPLKEITLRLPVRVGYWTYTKTDWVERIQGTVEANIGVEFIPELQFPSVMGMRNELSINLFAGYRYGMNAGSDPLQAHSIIINPSVTYHFNFYSNNWGQLGLGVLFEFGIWHVEETAYGTVLDYTQSLTGLSVLLGYSYRIAERLTVDIGANMYVYFAQGASPVVRPYLGISVIIVGGKHSGGRR